MIQSKKIKLLLSLIVAMPSYVFTQTVSAKVVNSFPPSVVRRLYEEVLKKTPLETNSQIWLATAYSKQDSLVAFLLSKRRISSNEIQRIIDSTDVVIETGLKDVMTPIEKNDFKFNIEEPRAYALPIYRGHIFENAEMSSQFGLAFKMHDAIGLSEVQTVKMLESAVELRKRIDFCKANPDSGYFDRAAFESEQMAKILTDEQINPVLAAKNRQTCELQARYDWHDLQKLGLANSFNKDSTLKQLMIYHLIIADITDRFANEKEKRALLYSGVKMPESLVAIKRIQTGNKAKLAKYAW